MGKIAFVYPGQGAQKFEMGKDFYDTFPVAKRIFDKADEILDISVTDLCFKEDERLHQTAYTQAALVTTCLAITEVLKEKGIYPDMTAGLSLGEYAAIATAGGISIENAIKTVRERGIYMEEAVPGRQGAMAAVLGMEVAQIEKVLSTIEGAYIANYNCPGQIVITGMKESVDKACEALKEAGCKRCLPLKVSGPFHSPYLRGAGEKLGVFMEEVEFIPLQIPYVTNVTAEPVENIQETRELLVRQVSSSVRWIQSVERMIAEGVDTFVEIGPGKTLAGFIKKINPDVKVINISQVADLDTFTEDWDVAG
ncbi:MAG: ACP S-malonyltransferase [Lachnospiraceae bacterium]|nr:ACP S-malonyltransferase [Lachnospiraceae bacterium]